MSIKIIIDTCRDCKNCKVERDYTSDSFETCWRFDCRHKDVKDKNIARYIDWYEKDPEIPSWCPRR